MGRIEVILTYLNVGDSSYLIVIFCDDDSEEKVIQILSKPFVEARALTRCSTVCSQ